ncbi:MAG TPA: helix-turn-helix transcriptional regulator [Thermoanaerobaculia bacterium]|nr:helix-turn-helix transcriptional regulator [Thermoanaerobaculia bacterium]
MKADERVARQIGKALRRLRLEQDLVMKQVAGPAGITISMLSCYEHGHRCPTLPNLVNTLRALDCSAEDFGSRLGPWGCLP